ncbi:hypothetical protein QJS10_CPB13g01211 [Acorus calamus]|uniref:Uncharacterized protein n=1 Tax=Acorus calamus TaxID=4465 RepID=A0AAV9DJZ4_ACOCL|nr:hypothetical protein QJS10_CPB13g01211 [Acorus calamus]
MNNIYGEDNPYCCYYHPKEMIIGICSLCLKERLLILASKQGISTHKDTQTAFGRVVLQRKPSTKSLPKVFTFLNSRLNDPRHRPAPPDDVSDDDNDTIISQDDSFISIKFEDDGKASWDKARKAAAVAEARERGGASKCVVEHTKQQLPPGRGSMRWQKRIGHMFQLLKWRRQGKAAVVGGGTCHVGLGGRVDGMMGRSWMRSLTRRRTTEL